MRGARWAGGALVLAVVVGLAGVGHAEWGSALEADGQALRGARLAAFVRTGDPVFLARWGEPLVDAPPTPPAGLRSPYPPIGAALGALAPAALGPGPGAARVGAALGLLVLLGAAARAGRQVGGAAGALIAAGLVAASPVVQAAGRLPFGESWAAAAALWALPAVAAGRGGARAGLRAGLAFLVKWTVVPALLPAALGRLGGGGRRDAALGGGLLVGAGAAGIGAVAGTGAVGGGLLVAVAVLVLAGTHRSAARWPAARGVAAAVALGLPWVLWAGPALAVHVAGHRAEAPPVGVAAGVAAARALLPVLLPGGALVVLGALPLLRRPLVGPAWAGGALTLALAVGAGRPWALGLGSAQDRLLVAPAALFAVAAAGWGATRIGRPLAGAAVVLGAALSLLPLLPGGPPGPVLGARRLAPIPVCGAWVDPTPLAYRWVPPGLAVAPAPRARAAPPRLAGAAAALPPIARPRVAAVISGDDGCGLEESDLLAFAAVGRIGTVAPRSAPEALDAWLAARRPAVGEIIGTGDAGVRAVARLVADGGWDWSARGPGLGVAVPAPRRAREVMRVHK